MPVPKIRLVEHTPVTAPRGIVVHAAALRQASKTACGKKMSRWVVSLRELDCQDCKRALLRHNRRLR